MNAYRQHTTESLLHIARTTRPLALVQEIERRFNELERAPGGREWFTARQKVEFDLMGGVLTKARRL
jgi:hypothetical protein